MSSGVADNDSGPPQTDSMVSPLGAMVPLGINPTKDSGVSILNVCAATPSVASTANSCTTSPAPSVTATQLSLQQQATWSSSPSSSLALSPLQAPQLPLKELPKEAMVSKR